jgi:hypothetical protein
MSSTGSNPTDNAGSAHPQSPGVSRLTSYCWESSFEASDPDQVCQCRTDLWPGKFRTCFAPLAFSKQSIQACLQRRRFQGWKKGQILREVTVNSIRAAFETAGIELIPKNGDGAGVRFTRGHVDLRFEILRRLGAAR